MMNKLEMTNIYIGNVRIFNGIIEIYNNHSILNVLFLEENKFIFLFYFLILFFIFLFYSVANWKETFPILVTFTGSVCRKLTEVDRRWWCCSGESSHAKLSEAARAKGN